MVLGIFNLVRILHPLPKENPGSFKDFRGFSYSPKGFKRFKDLFLKKNLCHLAKKIQDLKTKNANENANKNANKLPPHQ